MTTSPTPCSRGETIDIAIGIILHPTDDAVLIAQRKSNVHLPNLWEFPGGKCEAGETPEQAVVRECMEEVGLSVEIAEAWPSITHSYPDRTVILHPYLCRTESVEARPLDNRQVAWCPRGKITTYTFPAANQTIIERLMVRET